MAATISTEELKGWIDEGRDFVLLDVLGKDAFEALHLPGAANACVYEVTFLDQVQANKGDTIVVYGSSENSLDSADAADRLREAGYEHVHRYAGGRAAWQEAGHSFEGTQDRWVARPPRPLAEGAYTLDGEASYVEWTGRNVGNRHYGTLRFAAGHVAVRDGALTSAEFELDMKSIEVGDLDGEMAQVLIAHLEHEDFFHADRFPTARIALVAATSLPGATPGAASHEVEAEVTLRGTTARISFDASVAHKGDDLALQANFDFDRTDWGVNYGSGKLYEWAGMHLVNDRITLQICAIASPAS